MQKSYRASWISLAICQHTGIAVSGRYSGGSPDNEGLPFVNAKRVYRIMSENSLLLLHDKPSRRQREHKGRISVKESDQRWCSDGFEFGCDDGEKPRVTFVLDCCDREAIDWAASTGGYDKATVQDVMLGVKWSTKTGHRVRVFSSIDFPIRLVVAHHYIRAVLVRCNIQRYSPLLRELHR